MAIAYLVGSIPFGWLMGKLFFKEDIRQAGSGNIGATNALRRFGTVPGIIVLLLDMLKGFAVAWVAKDVFGAGSYWIPIAGAMTIIGHMFPLWLNFKGGKGVATAAGVFIALTLWPVLIALATFLITVFVSRYVSLGSILAALALLLSSVVSQAMGGWDLPMLAFVVLLVAMVIFKHVPNIKRLLAGNENRLQFSRKGSR